MCGRKRLLPIHSPTLLVQRWPRKEGRLLAVVRNLLLLWQHGRRIGDGWVSYVRVRVQRAARAATDFVCVTVLLVCLPGGGGGGEGTWRHHMRARVLV